MKLTYYGHSCFLVECGGKKLLFDPFIRYNELAASKVDFESLKADYILLSHAHQDHVADAIDLARQTDATVICAYELMGWLVQNGHEKVHPMNIGGKKQFDFGSVKCVVAHHSSGFADGTYGGNPMGFVISSPEGDFYYSGDTALTLDMQLIPMWGNIQFAVMPIGDNFTMGADDAATAAEWVKTKQVVGVHYDTFGYIIIDKEAAGASFAAKGIQLHLPDIGQTIDV